MKNCSNVFCYGLYFLALVCMMLAVPVNASDLAAEEIEAEEQQRVLAQLDLHKTDDDSQLNEGIVTFDVSDENGIAIGLDNDVIIFLDHSYQVASVYEFHDRGPYYIYWEGEDLTIYFAKTDHIVTITPQGHIVNVQKAGGDLNTLSAFEDALQQKTSVESNGIRYDMKKTKDPISNFFAGDSYHTLLSCDASGQETVVFYADKNTNSTMSWMIVIIINTMGLLVLSFFLFVPKALRNRIIRAMNKKLRDTQGR